MPFSTPALPQDESFTVLLDGNVRWVKLCKGLAEAGFTVTFDAAAAVLRISERINN